MTKQEELSYLFGILSEASKWSASSDDPRDLVRMEVEERVANLIQGVTPEPDENGLIQSTIHPDNLPAEDEALTGADYQTLEAAKLNEHLEQKIKQKQYTEAKESWGRDRVRVFINGKPVWKKRSECRQVPRDNSHGGLPWTWKWLGATITTEEKKAQEEKMWTEHEQEGK